VGRFRRELKDKLIVLSLLHVQLTKDMKVIRDYIIKRKVFVCLRLYYKFPKDIKEDGYLFKGVLVLFY
jgi:hypothetical protein